MIRTLGNPTVSEMNFWWRDLGAGLRVQYVVTRLHLESYSGSMGWSGGLVESGVRGPRLARQNKAINCDDSSD